RSKVGWSVTTGADLTAHACEISEDCYTLSVVDRQQFARILDRLASPEEFLSDHGVRSLSKYHRDHPFVFGNSQVRYEPAEEDEKLKGGNSNWRGPIWFPTSYLIVESLMRFNRPDLSEKLAERLIGIFKRDSSGRRPVF